MYSQAADADGKKWAPPVDIEGETVRLNNTCIYEIAGHPAIGYLINYGYNLKFAIYY
jgi:hypothetical protein